MTLVLLRPEESGRRNLIMLREHRPHLSATLTCISDKWEYTIVPDFHSYSLESKTPVFSSSIVCL